VESFWLLSALELAAVAYDDFVVGSVIVVDGEGG